MSPAREPIAVIGTGYVGLVTAAGFAELGSEVWCVDVDADKIAALTGGAVPIYEPGLAESLAASRERLHFSTELDQALDHARLLFVAVGTPATYSGDADLSAVNAVADAVPASDRHALVMKSTVPVGTGQAIRHRLDQAGKSSLSYVSCPEFLKEGAALADFRRPDRVVVGDDGGWAGDAVAELYAPLDAPLIRTDVASAEMIKLAANAFLATKISFINEIANVCEETGADVLEVARGMGLDRRIGDSFLRPGVGYGGSCLLGEETLLVRLHGRTMLITFEQLWRRLRSEYGEAGDGMIEPDDLRILSWIPEHSEPLFLDVACVTRRDYSGDVVEVQTKMGRRVTTTADHPWIVGDGGSGCAARKLAGELTERDWVPIALGGAREWDSTATASLLGAVEAAEIAPDKLIVRPDRAELARLLSRSVAARREIFARAGSVGARSGEVRRTGTLRLDEACLAELRLAESTLGTTKNGTHASNLISLDSQFWRVVGLYLAEGCATTMTTGADRGKIQWSLHPTRERHLADELCAFWQRQNVRATTHHSPTVLLVTVRSRLLAAWWTGVLGLGRGSCGQRLPDLIWDQPASHRWALLSGLFEGDGSWSLVGGGPSVIIELGTVSDELADGVMRLLASLGIVVARRIGRARKSTKDTHWLRISGAEQVERAIELIPVRDRPGVLASIVRQSKRIAPTGYRRHEGAAWVRVTGTTRRSFSGAVYSVEVPYAHTLVTTASVGVHNCFPKDVSALKQLAGSSGYHFQLLTAVIEVNELQKRRVVAKLQKHLGMLVGRRIALLGLAFKPETDDMREASSLVLAARLNADGASVTAYDPVAAEAARRLMPGVELADSALAALSGADAAVVVTEWDEFARLDWHEAARAMSGRLVIDGRNCVDRDQVEAAGLTYEGVGR